MTVFDFTLSPKPRRIQFVGKPLVCDGSGEIGLLVSDADYSEYFVDCTFDLNTISSAPEK